MTGKVRKVKLADVLWDAANTHLWSGHGSRWNPDGYKSEFSCGAVGEALCQLSYCSGGDEAVPFLRRLGCPVSSEVQRFGTSDVQERQSRRYMWLLLAMHAAEDEGIEIEVQA